jgi:hypothetical protein
VPAVVGHVLGRHIQARAEQHGTLDRLAGGLVDNAYRKLASRPVLHVDRDRFKRVVVQPRESRCGSDREGEASERRKRTNG